MSNSKSKPTSSMTQRSPLEWARGSLRSSGSGGALDSSRGSAVRFGGGGNDARGPDAADLDRSSSAAAAAGSNPQQVRRYIRHLSNLVADPIELDLDSSRLQNAVREAGEHSLGVDAISVWMLNDETGKLFMPSGGWWRSNEMEGCCEKNRVALARLEDPNRDDYVAPKPVSPGTDIAGILWTESRGGKGRLVRRSSTRYDSAVSLKSVDDVLTVNYQPIRWRDIHSISQDPDSAKGPRLALMVEAGFRMTAGIVFQYHHHQGMVFFLTTVEDENDECLTHIANSAYLYQAAQFIGATMSLAELRRASLAERHKLKEKCYSMAQQRTAETMAQQRTAETSIEEGKGGTKASGVGDDHISNIHGRSHCHLPRQVNAWLNKMKGGAMQIPPSLSWEQTLWTVFGSFVGLLLLSSLNQYYKILSDDEYHLLIGPFGAMCTLMYGLSSAPASQPRNAIFGQAVAGAVSLAFTYIPEKVLPVWIREAVGPAFSIGTMVKLGIAHPPAGAHSVLYASGKFDWTFYALVVFSTAISVIPATIVNNMSSKRQYPIHWGLKQLSQPFLWFRHRFFIGEFGVHSYRKSSTNATRLDSTFTETERQSNVGKMNNDRKQVQPKRLVAHEEEDESPAAIEHTE